MAGQWNLARFKLEDLYQMAVTVERKGYEFYGKLMEESGVDQVKNEMRFLRDEEAAHQSFFESELARRGMRAAEPGPELDELLNREFLGPLQERLQDVEMLGTKDALRFGLALEQKSIDFYNALKAAHAATVTGDLDAIIAQEEKHKRKIKIILAY
jgi:rubrerythrin